VLELSVSVRNRLGVRVRVRVIKLMVRVRKGLGTKCLEAVYYYYYCSSSSSSSSSTAAISILLYFMYYFCIYCSASVCRVYTVLCELRLMIIQQCCYRDEVRKFVVSKSRYRKRLY